MDFLVYGSVLVVFGGLFFAIYEIVFHKATPSQ